MNNRPTGVLIGAQNLATIVFSVLLVAYIAFLLTNSYLSQTDLKKHSLAQLQQETEKRASAVAYFFAERKNDLRNLAASRVVSAYFENKALGMSLEYGLRASLLAISERFHHLVAEKTISGDRIYNRLILVDDTGGLLVDSISLDSNQDNKEKWRGFLTPGRRDAFIVAERSKILISMPCFLKSAYLGQIVAWIVPQSVYDHLLKTEYSLNQFVGIASSKDNLYHPEDMSADLLFAGLSDLRKLGLGKPTRFELPCRDGSLVDMIALRTPVDDTPFSVINVLPVSTVYGHTTPSRLLFAMATLSVLVLGGCVFVWRNHTHKLVLRARLDEASKSKQEVEEKNRRLKIEITERNQAEEALRESEEKYRTVLEANPDPVVVYDIDGKVIYFNPAFSRVFGWTLQECLGKKMDVFVPTENWPETRTLINKVLAGESFSGIETRRYTREGNIIPVNVSGSVYHDRGGNPVGSVINLRDISAQKNLEAQLQHAQKMEAVGTLAGGFAHDFNNMLQAVQGYTELLLLSKKQGEPDYQELQEINGAARKGAELIKQLLTFSRKVESRLRPINVNQEVEQARKLLHRTIPKMIAIELHQFGSLWTVNADPTQLEQIIINLALNARDAMPDGGKLIIETKNAVLDEEYCRGHVGARPGDYVLLTLSDTGEGMDAETLEHIFEPFYTTKGVGEGTGLGLAMVYGIVKNHGGYIWCSSEIGRGTTFEIYLPVIERQIEGSREELEESLRGGTEKILLVDDDKYIQDLGKRILTRFGYTVFTAADGESALSVYHSEKDRIDLVILDLIMPGMGGVRCLEELLKMDPHVKVLIASGYLSDGVIKENLQDGVTDFISKPYEMRKMLHVVREALNQN